MGIVENGLIKATEFPWDRKLKWTLWLSTTSGSSWATNAQPSTTANINDIKDKNLAIQWHCYSVSGDSLSFSQTFDFWTFQKGSFREGRGTDWVELYATVYMPVYEMPFKQIYARYRLNTNISPGLTVYEKFVYNLRFLTSNSTWTQASTTACYPSKIYIMPN